MKSSSYLILPLGITAFLASASPASANGGHVHLGGIFFLLLGGLVFVSGIGIVFYLLLRPSATDSDSDDAEEDDAEEDIY
jgi:hypothetical protein